MVKSAAHQRAIEFLNNLIEREEFDYVDNERVANADDLEEVAAYEYAAQNGCCGSYDGEYLDPETGIRFLVGCNYGH